MEVTPGGKHPGGTITHTSRRTRQHAFAGLHLYTFINFDGNVTFLMRETGNNGLSVD